MPESAGSDYEKKAKDAIASISLQDASKGPADIGKAAAQLIAGASNMAQDPHQAISAVARGAMLGAFLSVQDLPACAVEILKALSDLSLLGRVAPEQIMTWVLEGIAEMTPQAGLPARSAIREKLEAQFVGISSVFDPLCDKAFKKSQESRP